MKILYIGPYRNELSVGQASRNIISSLSKSDDLCIRPIYIQNYNNFLIDNNILELESKNIEGHYDIIIQHSTPYLLAHIDKKTNITTKNIAIPIINKTINKYQYSLALSDFDNILVDNPITQSILQSSYDIKSLIFSYDLANLRKNELKMDLDIHNQNKKFYFIGSFYQNKSIIKKIITSFYLSFSHLTDISLLLFFTEPSDSIKNEFNIILEDIKKELNLVNSDYLHKVIVKTLTDEETMQIHDSCDIYISFNDAGTETSFHKSMAASYGNQIIDESNTNTTYDIHQGYGDLYFARELRLTADIVSLSESMFNVLQSSDKFKENTNYPLITDILCQ